MGHNLNFSRKNSQQFLAKNSGGSYRKTEKKEQGKGEEQPSANKDRSLETLCLGSFTLRYALKLQKGYKEKKCPIDHILSTETSTGPINNVYNGWPAGYRQ